MFPESLPPFPALCLRTKSCLGHQAEKGPRVRVGEVSPADPSLESRAGHLEPESIFLRASYSLDGLSLRLGNGLA